MAVTKKQTIFALIALSLGGFGIGANEFTPMGLLPEFAADLLAGLYQADQEAALGRASIFIMAYACGVVVGAPLIAVLLNRFAARTVLLLMLLIFLAFNIATALAPTFEIAVLSRFLGALPHGAYFGLAGIVAANLMGPGNRGKGIAYVLLGLTVANVVGVPLITAFGQLFGWRAAMLAVAVIFGCAAVAVRVTVPWQAPSSSGSVRADLLIFTRPLVWAGVFVAAIGISGFFAMYSFIAPVVTEVAQLNAETVPLLLVTIGCGMTLGNLIGGRIADTINPVKSMLVSLTVFAVSLTLLITLASNPIALIGCVLVCGIANATFVPPCQVWLMDLANDAPAIAGALTHSAFNLGNAIGAAGGGIVVASGLGFLSPAVFGVATTLVGMGAVLLVSRIRKNTAVNPAAS